MADIRKVTEAFAVAPQLLPGELPAAAAAGYAQIVNNRPDGEEPGQPTSAEMAAAAEAAGLAYLHLPVRGMPTPEQAEVMAQAVEGRPTLAFCRSGTRSIAAWALGQAMAGARPREELVRLCAGAGYDMSGLLGG